MASKLFLALILIAACGTVCYAQNKAKTVWGGATSFSDLAAIIFKRSPVKAPYASVGSGAGIISFNNGDFVVAVSDDPMTVLQETGTIPKLFGKLTLPLVLATYSFFAGAKSSTIFKLTAKSSLAIYQTGGAWSKYGITTIAGQITRFARGDNSGTTFVFKKYWKIGAGVVLPQNPQPLAFPGLVFVTGGKAICKAAAAKAGSIVYSQIGLCLPYATLAEALMQQGSGSFIKPSLGDPTAAIPRVLPPSIASWSAIGDQTILQKGPTTSPVVSFEYSFIRAKNLKQAGNLGTAGKSLLTWVVTNVGPLSSQADFYAVPASIKNKNLAALKLVV